MSDVHRIKPRLRVVANIVTDRHAHRRALVERACVLWPKLSQRKRWVRARERLGNTPPKTTVGSTHLPRTPRTLRQVGLDSHGFSAGGLRDFLRSLSE